MPRLPFFFLLPLSLSAHDLSLSFSQHGPFTLLHAQYAQSQPAPFIQIQILNPNGQTHQSAQTDAQGYFAFRPAQPGTYRAIADDQLGHRVEISLNPSAPPPDPPSSPARWERIALGLSLLSTASSLWYAYRSRK